MSTFYLLEVLLFYFCLSVVFAGFLWMIHKLPLLLIFICKYFGWDYLCVLLLKILSYKYKQKYLQIYEETSKEKEKD